MNESINEWIRIDLDQHFKTMICSIVWLFERLAKNSFHEWIKKSIWFSLTLVSDCSDCSDFLAHHRLRCLRLLPILQRHTLTAAYVHRRKGLQHLLRRCLGTSDLGAVCSPDSKFSWIDLKRFAPGKLVAQKFRLGEQTLSQCRKKSIFDHRFSLIWQFLWHTEARGQAEYDFPQMTLDPISHPKFSGHTNQ